MFCWLAQTALAKALYFAYLPESTSFLADQSLYNALFCTQTFLLLLAPCNI